MGILKKLLQQYSSKKNQEGGSNPDESLSRTEMYNQIRQQENQRYLDELLAQKRPDELMKRIKEVLKHEPDILKRIDIIEQVDRRGPDVLKRFEVRIKMAAKGGSTAAKKAPQLYRFEDPDALGLQDPELAAISMPPGPDTLGKYIFTEFSKISAFGRRTQLLKPQFFRLRHVLSPTFHEYWNTELKTLLKYLDKPLLELFINGWKTLEIEQYNLVVLLYGASRYYFDSQLLLLDKRISDAFIRTLKPFLVMLLKVLKHPDAVQKLEQAWQSYFTEDSENARKMHQALTTLRILCDSTHQGPSTVNCLLAILMAKQRRYLAFEEMAALVKSKVSTTTYQCPNSILSKILMFIEKQKKSLEALNAEYALFSELAEMTEAAVRDAVCMELYSIHPNAANNSEAAPAAQSCSQIFAYDIIHFLEKTTAAFLEHASPLLIGSTRIKHKEGEIRLFPFPLFGPELQEVQRILQSMQNTRIGHEHLSIDLEFYQSFIHNAGRSQPLTETEKTYCSLALNMADIAFQIAARLNGIIRKNRHWHQETFRKEMIPPEQVNEYIADIAATIVEPRFFKGVSLKDALNSLLFMSLGFALLLEEPRLTQYFARRDTLSTQITELSSEIERFQGFSRQLAHEDPDLVKKT